MAGSSPGIGASQKVMEVYKDFLKLFGNQLLSIKAKEDLIMRLKSRIRAKACLNDPIISSGRVIAQLIKVTLGITG